jgi:hypothetical protein
MTPTHSAPTSRAFRQLRYPTSPEVFPLVGMRVYLGVLAKYVERLLGTANAPTGTFTSPANFPGQGPQIGR